MEDRDRLDDEEECWLRHLKSKHTPSIQFPYPRYEIHIRVNRSGEIRFLANRLEFLSCCDAEEYIRKEKEDGNAD